MWAVLKGLELRLHDGVAHLAAELVRVHVIHARIGRQRDDEHVDERDDDEQERDVAMAWIVEVHAGPHELRAMTTPAPRRKAQSRVKWRWVGGWFGGHRGPPGPRPVPDAGPPAGPATARSG